jgi:prefoldin subunit 5
MYITPQELKSQVRDLRAELLAIAKDLGGEIQFLNQRINELYSIIENQSETIRKLTNVQ